MERGLNLQLVNTSSLHPNFYISKHFESFKWALATSRSGYRLQNTSFRILLWIYCPTTPNPTRLTGYHRVTKAAKNADITKMTCPSPSSQTLWSRDPEKIFWLKGEKLKKIRVFQFKKWGGSLFQTLPPTRTPPPLLPIPLWAIFGKSGLPADVWTKTWNPLF